MFFLTPNNEMCEFLYQYLVGETGRMRYAVLTEGSKAEYWWPEELRRIDFE